MELLEACALYRYDERPERFLLEARRALESAIFAMRERHFGDGAESLDDLFKKLQGKRLLDAKRKADFDVIRSRTNPAAHVPRPDQSVSHEDVERVAAELPGVAEWLFGDRSAADYPEAAVAQALKQIAGAEKREPPSAELARLRREQEDLQGELDAERQKRGTLREELADAERRASERPPPGQAANRWRGVLVGVLVGAAVGGAAGYQLRGPATASEPANEMLAEAPASVSEQLAGENVVPASRPTPSAAASDVPEVELQPRPECPAGSTRVAPEPFRLGPPPDRDWIPAAARASDHDVAPFCVANTLVTSGEFDECVNDGACRRQEQCRSPTDPNAPAACVARDEANRYCAWRFESGASLPSVAQLEALARTDSLKHLVPPAPGDGTARFEWVLDPCPSTAFSPRRAERDGAQASLGRLADPPADPRPRISWHCPAANGTVLHHFRCVVLGVSPN